MSGSRRTVRQPPGSGYRGKLADPEVRKARAKKASDAAHTVSTYVRQVVARAPDLTTEDAELLRSILPPAPKAGNSDAA